MECDYCNNWAINWNGMGVSYEFDNNLGIKKFWNLSKQPLQAFLNLLTNP